MFSPCYIVFNSFDFIVKKKGKLYDIEGKAFNGKNALDNSLDKGARQANRVLVDVMGNTNTNYISGNIKNAFEQNGLLSEIWLLKGSRLIKVRRLDYLQNEFIKKFRRIWENKKGALLLLPRHLHRSGHLTVT